MYSTKLIGLQLIDEETDYVLMEREWPMVGNMLPVFLTRFGRRENRYFVGCLRDARVNGRDLDLTDDR